MSGIFTVPFTVGTILYSGSGRGIFGAMAVLAFLFTAYRIWSDERRQLVALEQHLAPRLRLEFDPRQPKFVNHTPTSKGMNMIFIRVIARALSPTVQQCRGYLQRISQWDGTQYVTLFDETLELPWSGNAADTQPRLVNRDVDAFLDVAWVADSDFAPPPFGFLSHESSAPMRLFEILQTQILPRPEQNLKLDLVVVGEDSENAYLSLNIHRSPRERWDVLQVGWMDGDAIRRDSNI